MGDHAQKKRWRACLRERQDLVDERLAFAASMGALDGERLVFVDESGFTQGMRLSHGYAPRGQRCVENAPFRAGRRLNVIGYMAVGRVGSLPVETSVGAVEFEVFVRTVLVPSLREGDVVVWDNHRIHSAGSVAMIEQAGARVLSLPRYSPELNAIEPLWSKVKHRVRRARVETMEGLRTAVREALESVTGSDIRGWIGHCGYCLPFSA